MAEFIQNNFPTELKMTDTDLHLKSLFLEEFNNNRDTGSVNNILSFNEYDRDFSKLEIDGIKDYLLTTAPPISENPLYITGGSELVTGQGILIHCDWEVPLSYFTLRYVLTVGSISDHIDNHARNVIISDSFERPGLYYESGTNIREFTGNENYNSYGHYKLSTGEFTGAVQDNSDVSHIELTVFDSLGRSRFISFDESNPQELVNQDLLMIEF